MRAGKQKRLEAAGWRVGTVGEFLGLSKHLLVRSLLAIGASPKEIGRAIGRDAA